MGIGYNQIAGFGIDRRPDYSAVRPARRLQRNLPDTGHRPVPGEKLEEPPFVRRHEDRTLRRPANIPGCRPLQINRLSLADRNPSLLHAVRSAEEPVRSQNPQLRIPPRTDPPDIERIEPRYDNRIEFILLLGKTRQTPLIDRADQYPRCRGNRIGILDRGDQTLITQVIAPDPVPVEIHPVDAVVGRHPQNSVTLFENVPDPIARKTVRIARIVVVADHVGPVVAIQPVPGAEPHVVPRIPENNVDRTVRETFIVCYPVI